MSLKTTRRWPVAMLVATALATVATLSARGWDDDKKFVRLQHCEEANGDPSKDQWPAVDCLEGHECVVCLDFSPPFGHIVGPSGTGNRYMPTDLDCSGDRVIGICTGTGGGLGDCDVDNYYVDGTCTGHVTRLEPQPTPGGGGDPGEGGP